MNRPPSAHFMMPLWHCTLEGIEERMTPPPARDWKGFHTPKNLATALSIEAAES